MRNILVVLAMFVCANIGLGNITINKNINGNNVYGNGQGATGSLPLVVKAPSHLTVEIIEGADNIGNVYGARVDDGLSNKLLKSVASSSYVIDDKNTMKDNKVKVYEIKPGFGRFGTNKSIYGARSNCRETEMFVHDNRVEISGGFNIRDVVGGYTHKGTVYENTVIIGNKVEIEGDVFGGHINKDGTATENKVNLDNVRVKSVVFGAKIVNYGNVVKNKVTIDNLLSAQSVFGGQTATGNAIENEVTIKVGTVNIEVYGGHITQNGAANGNRVNLTKVNVRGVYGAYLLEFGSAFDNRVTIENCEIPGTVCGANIGKVLTGKEISNNKVTINSGDFGNVYGAWIGKNAGTVINNEVTINDGNVDNTICGAQIIESKGAVIKNVVTISGGTVRTVYGANIEKVLIGAEISNNKVIIEGGNIQGGVYGAKIGESAGAVINNVVEINGGKIIGDVYGAKIDESKGAVINNVVTINGGELEKNVFGAKIERVLIGAEISKNKVIIKGGKVHGSVYGVWIDEVEGGKKISNLKDNQVRIRQGVYSPEPEEECYGAVVAGQPITSDNNSDNNKVVFIDRDVDEVVPPPPPPPPTSKKPATHPQQQPQQQAFAPSLYPPSTQQPSGYFPPPLPQPHPQQQQLAQHPPQQQYLQQQQQQYPQQQQQQGFAPNKSALTEDQVHERVAQLQQVQLSMTQLLNLQTNPSQLEPELPKLELQSLQKIFSTKLKELEQLNLSPIQIQKLLKELKGLSQEQKEQKLQVLVLQKSFPKRLNQLQQLPPAQLQALQGLPQQEQEKKLQEFELQERFPERLEQLKQLSEAQKLELQGLSREEQEQKLQKWEEEKQQSTTPPITEKIKFVDTVVDITGPTQFSPESELCGGCCPDPTVVFRGSTLNTRTKGIVVKGISNFENYNFYLKDIKAGDTILTATSGGYNSANKSACEMDLSRSNIYLQTQGVLNKGDYCTLIKSHKRFKNNVKYKKFDFENEEILIKYYWEVILTDDGQNLTAKLIDKKIRDEGIARSLSEGYGAGIVCVNNGMDYIFSKMEGTESLLGKQKGEIGVFCGLAANKSSYNTGLHIDMIGTSMMGGVGKVVEVREKELTVGVFAEYGTGNSDIHCEKESKGTSSYIGGGLLGRYNIYENEFSGTKAYVEAILRAGQANINFDGNEVKNLSGKEIKYEMEAMYGGCAVGGGCKHKVSEKIDLDWSLRYMVGYQDGKGAKQADADGSKAKFESVTSNRIRIGVRGKYVELEKIKPYAGIGCEYELDGKVKGAIQNGKDMIDMPVSDFGGVTGIGELGVSGKVWKFGVDISGQGYLGVRKGFGGMLKLKYAFGKDAHGSKASSLASSLASTKPQ